MGLFELLVLLMAVVMIGGAIGFVVWYIRN